MAYEIDYSGWPIYTRAGLPDDDAYKICDAIAARKDQMFWEDSYTGVGQLGENTDATPRDVPLHPGAHAPKAGSTANQATRKAGLRSQLRRDP